MNYSRCRMNKNVEVLSKSIRVLFCSVANTYASHVAMKGVPLNSIGELLGHEDSRTMKIYAHLSESHLKEMTDRLTFGKEKKVAKRRKKRKAVNSNLHRVGDE